MSIGKTIASRRGVFIGIVLLVSLTFQGVHAETIAIGPYVQRVTQREAVIHWMTLRSTVLFGTAKGELDGEAGVYEHHEVTLTNLEPGTRYHYNVSEEDSKEGMGYFVTAPKDREQSFTFVAYGDSRTRPDVHQKVVEAVIREQKFKAPCLRAYGLPEDTPDEEAIARILPHDPMPRLQNLEPGTPLPRTAIYHGSRDANIPAATSAVPLSEALGRAGAEVELELFPDVEHNVYGMGKPIEERLRAFFAKAL